MGQTDVAEIICKKTGESEMQKSQSSKGTDDASALSLTPPPPPLGPALVHYIFCPALIARLT